MRGTRDTDFISDPRARIIPADAGNTKAARLQKDREEDHPRGCGEHGMAQKPSRRARGSSPRMRGTQPRSPLPPRRLRIIPADAGNTIVWY